MTRAQEISDLLAGVTITTADNTAQLTLTSTDADANKGPVLDLYRNSGSPADADSTGRILFNGENDADEIVEYARIATQSLDVTDGSEDGLLTLDVMKDGTQRIGIEITGAEVVVNESSVDMDFRVESNGNANMLFVDAGNDRVGIGTGSPAFSNGTGLEVADATRACVRIEGNSGSHATEIYTDSTGGTIDARGSGAVLQFDIGGSERMRIDNTGRVSIHPDGTPFFGESSADNLNIYQTGANVGMTLRSDDDRAIGIYFADGASGAALYQGYIQYNHANQLFDFAGQGSVRLIAGGNERARIDSNGRFLIGTSSLINNDGAMLQSNGGTNLAFGFNVNYDGTLGRFYRSSSIVGSISVTTSSTNYATSSDRRLKSNIQDAASASSKIDAIQVRQFDWNADDSHQDYGLIAQELQPIEPLAVTGDADSDEMMGVDYSKLVPMLIKEIQELRSRVAALEE